MLWRGKEEYGKRKDPRGNILTPFGKLISN